MAFVAMLMKMGKDWTITFHKEYIVPQPPGFWHVLPHFHRHACKSHHHFGECRWLSCKSHFISLTYIVISFTFVSFVSFTWASLYLFQTHHMIQFGFDGSLNIHSFVCLFVCLLVVHSFVRLFVCLFVHSFLLQQCCYYLQKYNTINVQYCL